jgi:hypothetical protein
VANIVVLHFVFVFEMSLCRYGTFFKENGRIQEGVQLMVLPIGEIQVWTRFEFTTCHNIPDKLQLLYIDLTRRLGSFWF